VVKHLLLPAHERLLGRPTAAYLRLLEESQWWPLDRLLALQQSKLRRLLRHAWAKCPFYRSRIEEAGVDVDRVVVPGPRRDSRSSLEGGHGSSQCFSALPMLSKADIRANAADMVDPTVRGGLHPYTTGGSSGDPLIFKIDRSRQAADQAARARSRRWFGIDLGQRELYLWGAPVELAAQDRLKGIRDRLTNHRLLSAFKMTPQRMSAYLDEIERFDPVHIFGYPSSLVRLIRHAQHGGRSLRTASLKAVFTTGELLPAGDRDLIAQAVEVPVADGYGSREAGFIAHQCPQGRYHITMESMIVELLDGEGRAVHGDEAGEVTITHLDALGMPFIRYRTGDIARWGEGDCPCGRDLLSLEIIQGRKTDMLRTTDGGFAHALSVIYCLRDEPAIREFKVVQRRNLHLDVSVVADDTFGQARKERVCRMLGRRIGQGVAVRLSLVDQIPPDPSGKHRYVVCEAR